MGKKAEDTCGQGKRGYSMNADVPKRAYQHKELGAEERGIERHTEPVVVTVG